MCSFLLGSHISDRDPSQVFKDASQQAALFEADSGMSITFQESPGRAMTHGHAWREGGGT